MLELPEPQELVDLRNWWVENATYSALKVGGSVWITRKHRNLFYLSFLLLPLFFLLCPFHPIFGVLFIFSLIFCCLFMPYWAQQEYVYFLDMDAFYHLLKVGADVPYVVEQMRKNKIVTSKKRDLMLERSLYYWSLYKEKN